MIKKPQFIVVGAPKCGTTALHTYLRRQPGVFVPELKEPHFFASDIPIRRRLDATQYLSLFEPAPASAVRGEVSVWYLYSQLAAKAIHHFCGDIRIVMMLRHPVQAMQALHGQFVLNGDEDLLGFEAALGAEEGRLQGGNKPRGSWVGARCLCYRAVYRYAEQVERYWRVFGPERVHVMLFDDFAGDTAAAFGELLEFLQVPWQQPADLSPVLRHRRLRWPWLKGLERRFEGPVRQLARRWLPHDALRRRLGKRLLGGLRRFNSRRAVRPALGFELEERLRLEMAPDIRRLEALLERTTGWLDLDATNRDSS